MAIDITRETPAARPVPIPPPAVRGEDAAARPLLGQWAMVTGAGRGIGEEIARQFAASGASLVLTELPDRLPLLEESAAALRREHGVQASCLPLDLRRFEQIEEAAARIGGEVEAGVDYLVNNAGVNLLQPALSLTQEEWDFVVDINLKGTFFLTREVAKAMVRKKRGSIVMIASQHGVVANENRAPYCASKAGLIHLSKALAVEWAKYGIRVNTVSPTFVLTEASEPHLTDPQFLRANLPKLPLRRFATPEDIARSALFLATDAAGMITGHNLVVDGGWTAI
ncbi:SDR family oxidoreductase [Paenibacillus sp. FSL W8-1187]|uniref:SDR family NAD(P)-dependent oxidoreductase n=1 Tax=unclassified Paenibacillus TaxID=185978 RepID=UPI00129AFF4F|nr:SDR family oxidoreductase [Paenibacillus sp. B01]QGG54426.1 SDR family oxidoreductase [Paenibacillus sp. B01]